MRAREAPLTPFGVVTRRVDEKGTDERSPVRRSVRRPAEEESTSLLSNIGTLDV